ncbi:hypothetical protein BH11ARM2_BH11ARM2_33730 [soil metagenome]
MGNLQRAAVTLLREAFEGRVDGNDYTWFVEGREGVFDALASVDAETASRRTTPNSPTLAAHAYHMLYLLRSANTWQGKPSPKGNWESSWAKQTATQQEWAELAEAIRHEYASYLAWFAANEEWNQEDIYVGALATLPHVAYHLGAMRHLVRELKDVG